MRENPDLYFLFFPFALLLSSAEALVLPAPGLVVLGDAAAFVPVAGVTDFLQASHPLSRPCQFYRRHHLIQYQRRFSPAFRL
jgi:hypothetical protein